MTAFEPRSSQARQSGMSRASNLDEQRSAPLVPGLRVRERLGERCLQDISLDFLDLHCHPRPIPTGRYMECYRRAMLPEQTFEGRHENLNQANKLSRTFAALIEALDRHRGKGQQRITVEHVNVHPGWTGDRGGGE